MKRAEESYPEGLRVVVGAGGPSRQIHGKRAGFDNTDWDREFLETFRDDPEASTHLRHADWVRLGGSESVEQITWMAMRGALDTTIAEVHRHDYFMTTTAMTVVAHKNRPAEDNDADRPAALYITRQAA